MPSSVDNRIVEMQFDNKRFEKNIHQSIASLEELDEALQLKNGKKGFEEMEKAADEVDFSKLISAADLIEKRFSAAGIAGAAVINRGVNSAISLVHKLGSTVAGLVKTGGVNRALKLEHANFMLEGLIKNSEKVTEILNGPVNNAVSGTAYGLDSAANAAAQFVASGIKDLDKLETALTGISGVAAMSGASYDEIANIFTKVAASGRMMGDSVMQLSTRGINAQAELAKYLGKTTAEVQEMQKKGEISFDLFAEAMNDAFGEQAKKANETFTGAMSNVKAALSRIGAKVATPTIESLRKIFVALIDVVNKTNKALETAYKKINKVISYVLGSVEKVLYQKNLITAIQGIIRNIEQSFDNLMKILKPIKQAFKDIFPESAIDSLIRFENKWNDLQKKFEISDETAKQLRYTFRGLFAALDIIFTIIGQILSLISPAFGKIFNNSDSLAEKVLKVTGYIGNLLVILDDWVKKNKIVSSALELFSGKVGAAGDKLEAFKNIVKTVIAVVEGIITGVIGLLFMVGEAVWNVIQQFMQMPIIQQIIDDIRNAVYNFGIVAEPILESVVGWFVKLLDSLMGFASGNYLEEGIAKLSDHLTSLYWGFKNATGFIGSFFNLFKKSDDTIEKIEKITVSAERLYGSAEAVGGKTFTLVRNMDAATESVNAVADSFEETADKSVDAMNKFEGAGKVFAIGFAASIISAGVNIGRAFRNIGTAVKNIGGVGKSLRFFFDSLTIRIKSHAVIEIAGAIIALAGALMLMTLVDTGKLVVAAATLAGLLVVIKLLTKNLGEFNKANYKEFAKSTKAILSFSASLLFLAAAMKMLDKLDARTGKYWATIGSVILLMYSLAGALILLGRFQVNAAKGGLTMLTFAASIYMIMSSLKKIADLDIDNIKKAIPVLMEIIGGMAGIALATSLIISPFGGLSFMGVVAGILMMMEGMQLLSQVDYKVMAQVERLIDYIMEAVQTIILGLVIIKGLEVAEAGLLLAKQKLIGIIGSLKGMFALAQKGIKYIGVASLIIAIGGAIYLTAQAIINLSIIPVEDIFKGVAVVVVIMLGVMALTEHLIKISAELFQVTGLGKSIGTGLIGLGIAIAGIAGAMLMLKQLDSVEFENGLIKIAELMAVLAAFELALSFINKKVGPAAELGIKTVGAIVMCLAVMTGIVAVLSFIPWEAMGPALGALISMMTMLVLVFTALGTISGMTAAGTVAVFAVSFVIATLSAAMWALQDVDWLTAMINMGIIVGVVGLMGLIMKGLEKINGGAIVVIAAITGVFAAFTYCATLLEQVNPLKFLANIGVMALAIAGLTGIIAALGAIISSGGGAIILGIGAAALAVLAAEMAAFAVVALMFASAAKITADALQSISNTLKVLKDMDLSTIASGLVEIGSAGLIIGTGAIGYSALAVVLRILAPLLGVTALAVDVFATGLTLLSKVDLSDLNDNMEDFVDAIKTLISHTIELVIFTKLSEGLSIAVAALGLALTIFGNGLTATATGLLVVNMNLMMFATIISIVAKALKEVVKAITNMISEFDKLGAETIQGIYNALIEFGSTQLPSAGEQLVGFIADGYRDALADTVEDIIRDSVETIAYYTQKYASDFYNSGLDSGTSYDHGLRDGAGHSYCLNDYHEIPEDTAYTIDKTAKEVAPQIKSAGEVDGNAYGDGLWGRIKAWLEAIKTRIAQFVEDIKTKGPLQAIADAVKNGLGLDDFLDAEGKANSITDQISNAQYKQARDLGRKMTQMYFDNKKAQAEADEMAASAASSSAAASGKSSKATKDSTKATKANTDAVKTNTTAVEENSQAQSEWEQQIREQAEEIEVVTEKYKKYLDTIGTVNPFKNVQKMQKVFSTFWASGFTDTTSINTAAQLATDKLSTSIKMAAKGAYKFSDSGKYLSKLSASYTKNTNKIRKQVEKTGKTIAKVGANTAKVFYNENGQVKSLRIAVTKNVKSIGKQFQKAKSFLASFNDDITNTDSAEGFISNFRKIEKYFGTSKLKQIPEKARNYLKGVVNEMSPVRNSLNFLSKAISGNSNVLSKNSKATAYAVDGMLAFAASLYDGSDAANEYATEHERLLFLLENGLATEEEVAEHFKSYVSRITEALEEYRNTLKDTLDNSLDIWSEFNKNLLDEGTDLISNIESQIAGYTQWSDMLMEMSKRGLSVDLVKSLADEGVASYGKLAKMIEMTDGELALFQLRVQQSNKLTEISADKALAAIANAQTMASLRAAAAQGDKTAKKQLAQSKKTAEAMKEDIKAVAQYQATYNKLSKKEQKEYLKSLTAAQRKEYKKQYKVAKKNQKQLQKLANQEAATRAEKERIKTIQNGITSYTKYAEVIRSYGGDQSAINAITESATKLLKPLGVEINKLTKSDFTKATSGALKFAESLEETGEEGLSYMEEMTKRLENFVNGVVEAAKNVDWLTQSFQKVSAISMNDIMKQVSSYSVNYKDIIRLMDEVFKRDIPTSIRDKITQLYSSGDFAGLQALLTTLSKATDEQIKILDAKIKLMNKNSEEIGTSVNNLAKESVEDTIRREQNEIKASIAETQGYMTVQKQWISEAEKGVDVAQKNLDDSMQRIGYVDSEIERLTKKKNRTKKEDAELKTLKKRRKALQKEVDERTKMVVEARQILTDATKTYADSVKDLDEKEKKLFDKELELQKVLDEQAYYKHIAQVEADAEAALNAVDSYEKLIETLKEYNEETEVGAEVHRQFVASMEPLYDAFDMVNDSLGRGKLSYEEFGKGAVYAAERLGMVEESAEGATNSIEDSVKAITNWVSSLNNLSPSNPFEKFKAESETTMSEYLDNLKSQLQAQEEFSKNMETLQKRGISMELYQHLAELGVSGASNLAKEMANATDAELGEMMTNFKAVTETMPDTLRTQMAGGLSYLGSDVGQALEKGLKDAFAKFGEIRFPYGDEEAEADGYNAGKMVVTGIQNGIGDAQPEIVDSVSGAVQTAVNAASESLSTSDISSAVAAGVSSGFTESISNTVEAIKSTITNRTTEIGKILVTTMEDRSVEACDIVVNNFNDAVDKINKLIDEKINHEPVIKPVVDLSGFNSAIARMNSAIASVKANAASAQAAVNAVQASAAKVASSNNNTMNTTNVTFNQTNNSPKSLSTVEIYRQTQQQAEKITKYVTANPVARF